MMPDFSRLVQSARGETFNPLLWPFLFTTLAYGIGFLLPHEFVGNSNLRDVMEGYHPAVPFIWAAGAILTIVGGLTFLLFNVPPYGKASGLLGFMLWLFVFLCYAQSGDLLLLAAVAVVNMWFWIWQYVSLAYFRREEAFDKKVEEAITED